MTAIEERGDLPVKEMDRVDRYVIGRESNVLHVDFHREPDPPAPRFPGAGALRHNLGLFSETVDAVTAVSAASGQRC
jgi:hypothetical protein